MYRHKVVDADSTFTTSGDDIPGSFNEVLEAKLSFMDSNGIDVSIIRRVSGDDDGQSQYNSALNQHLNEICVKSEGRLFGLATILDTNREESARKMQELSTNMLLGIKGFVLACEVADIAGKVENYQDGYALFRTAADLGMPVYLQTVSNDDHHNLLVIKCLENMVCDGIFTEKPELRIVVTGNGMLLPNLLFRYTESEEKCIIKRNIIFTTGQTSGKFLDYLIDTAGNNSVMFGSSDSSGFDTEEYNFNFTQLTKQKVCGLNASAIFKLSSDYVQTYLNMEYITVLNSTAVTLLGSKLRDKNSGYKDFMIYSDRLMTILSEEALARVPSVVRKTIETPTGTYEGLEDEGMLLCVVSIVRSGDILLESIRKLEPGIRVGKILIQRDEESEDKHPIFFYDKLPTDISESFVLLVDPMVGTAGSMLCATDKLIENGVKPENILFVNLFSCEEGIGKIQARHPDIKIITLAIDDYMNSHKYLIPGVGDFGDRYYGTNH